MYKLIVLFIKKLINKKRDKMCYNCNLNLCEVCNCAMYYNLREEIADDLIIIGNWNK